MDLKRFEKAIFDAATDLVGREEELCKLDSFVGDGDHGISIKRAYSNVLKMMASKKAVNFRDFLFDVSMAVSETAGGAIGPILASFFLGMSDAVDVGKEELSPADMAALLKAGTMRVQSLGGAQPGDSTLVDALTPAYETLDKCKEEDEGRALEKMAQAAYSGAMFTKDMVAKKGRARYLEAKSKGYVDAGAMSMYYFLRAFVDGVTAETT
ncbi:MAG: dihydroxyacetone kinase subunit DhaL [Bacillota bacterium]|jgi:dihydroxyacetone kinase-like protein